MTTRSAFYCVVLVYSLMLVGPLAQVSVAGGRRGGDAHGCRGVGRRGSRQRQLPVVFPCRLEHAESGRLRRLSQRAQHDGRVRRRPQNDVNDCLGGNPDPAAANFAVVGSPFITSGGAVVFNANFGDTFRYDGRVIAPVVRNGDPASGGGTVTPCRTRRTLVARLPIGHR